MQNTTELQLSELETDVISAFLKREILNDRHIAAALMALAYKLEDYHLAKEGVGK